MMRNQILKGKIAKLALESYMDHLDESKVWGIIGNEKSSPVSSLQGQA